MPKTITSAMRTHLDEEVTTLATLWKIVRSDGVEHYFTDHDVDIVLDANTYRSDVGYNRTAVNNSSSLNVDNLDVVGFIDSAEITEEDLRAGRFDHSEVFISMVNYLDLNQGPVRMRRGRMGEVTLTEQGFFKAELRGLTQQLSQAIGELFSPECRADLGDERCKVPIDPPQVARSTAYAVGDYVKNDNLLSEFFFDITNASWETDDLTGWTNTDGNAETSAFGAQEGTYYLRGDAGAGAYLVEQTVDFPASADTAVIDAGGYEFGFTIYRANYGGDDIDTGSVVVEYLDGSSVLISEALDSGFHRSGDDGSTNPWAKWEWVGLQIPSGARKIRIVIEGAVDNGTTANACWDNVTASVREVALGGSLVNVPFINGSFEEDDLTGWTSNVAGMSVRGLGSFDPFVDGGKFVDSNSDGAEIEQVVDVTSIVDTTAVDAGEYLFDFSCYRGNDTSDNLDQGRILVEFLDSSDALTGVAYNTGFEAFEDIDTEGWQERAVSDVAVPADTRKVRVTFTGKLISGGSCNAIMDNVRAYLHKPPAGSVSSNYDLYENRIYRCTIAGTTSSGTVSYSRVVDDVDADGTASFICEEAWTRDFVVTSVTDRSTFTIDVDEARDADDWFNGGALFFESGNNEGLGVEIRDWTNSNAEIVLFLQTGYDVQVGDAGRLYPGCDKRQTTCKTQFSNVINFRGEPFIPGQDEYTNYPDAK